MLHFTEEETETHISEVSVLPSSYFAPKILVFETQVLPSI